MMGPGAGSSWQTVFSTAMAGDSSGWGGYNLRQAIGSTLLTAISGTKVRVTLEAAFALGFSMDFCEIGHVASSGDPYDFNPALLVPLTFGGGNPGVTLAPNTSVLSDAVTFAFNPAQNFIVAMHFSGAVGASSLHVKTPLTGAVGYYKSAASEVSVADVSGYSIGSSALYCVSKIEVQ